MKTFAKVIGHLFMLVLLTIVTQIGGIIYLFALFFFRKSNKGRRKRIFLFSILYLITTLIFVPFLALQFGRVKIKNKQVNARNVFYILANRNYVKPELNEVLQEVGKEITANYPNVGVKYLDANFPFVDGFPLLPHLSHNDGKKVDICFIYENSKGVSNQVSSVSGYGSYIEPKQGEPNQITICKSKGSWQYDFPKYLTFGIIHKDLQLSEEATKNLVNDFVNQAEVGKIFIEPHLKQRLNLTSNKVRYHGCQAVRHDDHIHVQLK